MKATIVLLCTSVAVLSAHAASDVKKLRGDRDKIAAEIKTLNTSLACRSDADCVALEMGRKPCGGPWKHLVASKKNPKLGKLKEKLATYAKADDALNKAAELMSDCSMAMAPTPVCSAKVCTTPEDSLGSESLKPQ
ncbi:MAG: hypothetical protein AAB250_17030 [Bdellovibrionota bacterium]